MSPEKKITVCNWLVVILAATAISLALFSLCGCEPPEPKPAKPAIQVKLKFKYGEVVALKIGGRGQIIGISQLQNDYYKVRVQGDNGPRELWLYGFELEIAPRWRSPC